MDLECAHIVLNVSEVGKARDFYIETLGFDIVEEHDNSFAFRAGSVRFTVSPGGKTLKESDPANALIIFRTTDIEKSVADLKARGVEFSGEVMEAPGFMKFIAFSDPDDNPLMLGEYSRDPLEKV
jgi:catechol 2,3-dioxygenase-like lactoylglutathione lyase family enzyme